MGRIIGLCMCFASASVAAQSLAASPCVQARPSAKAILATIRAGATWYLKAAGDEHFVRDDAPLVCVDARGDASTRTKIVELKNHVAIVYWVATEDVTDVPVTPALWKTSRGDLEPGEESGETGCLMEFRPGTPLYDGPGGAQIGLVTGGRVALGRWDVVDEKSVQWSQTRVRAKGAWVKTAKREDWCD